MKVKFWGTRGSLPAPLKSDDIKLKIRTAVRASLDAKLSSDSDIDQFIENDLPFAIGSHYGGDTSCVEIIGPSDDYVVCDTGSGLRCFGNAALSEHGPGNPKTYHIFQSHPHWDHVMGFPFFTPAFIPGNRIIIYGGHENLPYVFGVQQSAPHFPIDFKDLGATVEFVVLDVDKTHDIAGMRVSLLKQNHPGDSYAFRFESNGKSVVYSTDCEHATDGIEGAYPHVKFCKDVDLCIIDAMYSHVEARTTKDGWGHSSNLTAVEVAKQAGAKHLMLFHHDPGFSDQQLDEFYDQTVRYEAVYEGGGPMKVSMSYDGLEVDL